MHPDFRAAFNRAFSPALARGQAEDLAGRAGRVPGFRLAETPVFLTRELDERLVSRTTRMFARGLVDEIRGLVAVGLRDGVTARRAIGYAQALAQVRGEIGREEAISQTQALTRRYARRQVSWFRRYESVTWMDGATAAQSLAGSVA